MTATDKSLTIEEAKKEYMKDSTSDVCTKRTMHVQTESTSESQPDIDPQPVAFQDRN